MKAKLLLAAFGVFVVSAGAVAWSKLDIGENPENTELSEPNPPVSSSEIDDAVEVQQDAAEVTSHQTGEPQIVEPSSAEIDVAEIDPSNQSREFDSGSPGEEPAAAPQAATQIDIANAEIEIVVPTSAVKAVTDQAPVAESETELRSAVRGDDALELPEAENIVVAGVEVRDVESGEALSNEIDALKDADQQQINQVQSELDEVANDVDVLKLEIDRLRAELAAERAAASVINETVSGEDAVATMKPDTAPTGAIVPTSQAAGSADPDNPLAALGDVALPLTLTEVHFDTGQSALTPGGQRKTKEVFELLERLDNPVIRIEGYSDTTGSAARNLVLSEYRADAVRSMMIELGYDAGKVEIQAMGENGIPEPTGDGVSEPLNRCVGIVLVGYGKG